MTKLARGWALAAETKDLALSGANSGRMALDLRDGAAPATGPSNGDRRISPSKLKHRLTVSYTHLTLPTTPYV